MKRSASSGPPPRAKRPYRPDGSTAVHNTHDESFRCLICGDSCETPTQPATSACKHDVNVCGACLSSWISTELKASIWQITCPNPGCESVLKHADIKRLAEPEDWKRYESLSSDADTAKDFHWCGKPGCESGQFHEGNGNIFTCQVCNFKTCVECRADWHEGRTCAEAQARALALSNGDRQSDEYYISQVTRPCPDCNVKIEKNGGCNHMTCRCGHQFCWLCSADYRDIIHRDGNEAHGTECPFHSRNLVDPHARPRGNPQPSVEQWLVWGPVLVLQRPVNLSLQQILDDIQCAQRRTQLDGQRGVLDPDRICSVVELSQSLAVVVRCIDRQNPQLLQAPQPVQAPRPLQAPQQAPRPLQVSQQAPRPLQPSQAPQAWMTQQQASAPRTLTTQQQASYLQPGLAPRLVQARGERTTLQALAPANGKLRIERWTAKI